MNAIKMIIIIQYNPESKREIIDNFSLTNGIILLFQHYIHSLYVLSIPN